jgi:hypothetical protein
VSSSGRSAGAPAESQSARDQYPSPSMKPESDCSVTASDFGGSVKSNASSLPSDIKSTGSLKVPSSWVGALFESFLATRGITFSCAPPSGEPRDSGHEGAVVEECAATGAEYQVPAPPPPSPSRALVGPRPTALGKLSEEDDSLATMLASFARQEPLERVVEHVRKGAKDGEESIATRGGVEKGGTTEHPVLILDSAKAKEEPQVGENAVPQPPTRYTLAALIARRALDPTWPAGAPRFQVLIWAGLSGCCFYWLDRGCCFWCPALPLFSEFIGCSTALRRLRLMRSKRTTVFSTRIRTRSNSRIVDAKHICSVCLAGLF